MKKLWQLLISGFGVFLLSTAKPAGDHHHQPELIDLWGAEHVNKTCLTRSCNEAINVEHLRELRRYIRREADPCENFHEYACGNWRQDHANDTTMMKLANTKLNEKYVQLFERWWTEQQEERNVVGVQEPEQEKEFEFELNVVFEKMLHYYSVCKESHTRSAYSLRGYYEQMREQGMWRLQNFNWLATIAELGSYGYAEHFLRMSVNRGNASDHHIQVQPHNRHERVQLSAAVYDILRDYTKKDLSLLELEFRQLETDLEQIVQEPDDDVDLTEVYTLRELTQQSREIDWQLFFGSQMGRKLHDSDIVKVDDLMSVNAIAKYLNRTDGNLKFLYTLARFLNYLENKPHSILANTSGADGVAAKCMRHMRKTLHIPMAYVYDHAFYGRVRDESDRVIFTVFNQLKTEFRRMLEQNRIHLSAPSIRFLQAKLSALRLNIGNLPLNVTVQFYVDYVSNLNVTENFYYNHLHALQHHYAHQRFLVDLHPTDVANPWYTFHQNAPDFPDNIDSTPFYYCLSNMIIIPHAYLQTPFYDQRFWPVLLYGDLATTLGHELIHAFDNEFLLYDYFGNTSEDYKAIVANPYFKHNIACLDDGTAFLTERIADISGTRLAMNTFMRDPLFQRSNGKLFFLQFAQFFCGDPDPSTFKLEDPYHDLDSLRLNYTLAHMPEFAEVFECPLGSPMNPVKKCQMW